MTDNPIPKGARMLSVRVPRQLLKRVRQRALDDDTTSQAVVIAALESYFKEKRGA